MMETKTNHEFKNNFFRMYIEQMVVQCIVHFVTFISLKNRKRIIIKINTDLPQILTEELG